MVGGLMSNKERTSLDEWNDWERFMTGEGKVPRSGTGSLRAWRDAQPEWMSLGLWIIGIIAVLVVLGLGMAWGLNQGFDLLWAGE